MTNAFPIFLSLVKAVGMDEAVILQKLHSWLIQPGARIVDGKPWARPTYEEWETYFPARLFSEIRHTLKNLERRGLVISACDDQDPMYQMQWYTIDYDQVATIMPQSTSRLRQLYRTILLRG